jgi:hypothetical protein
METGPLFSQPVPLHPAAYAVPPRGTRETTATATGTSAILASDFILRDFSISILP